MKVFVGNTRVAEVDEIEIFVRTLLIKKSDLGDQFPTQLFFESLGPADFSKGYVEVGKNSLLITDSTWILGRKN
jgi:hypothetical protein